MTKQPSIEQMLRQQISQLDELGNEQLNELLEKLERQKEKLPPEDHPIIDWGISVIRVKELEKKLLQQEMDKEFEDRYSNYQDFVLRSGLERLNLKNNSDKEKLYNLGLDHLDEILTKSCQQDDERYLEYANHVTGHIKRFCIERGEGSLPKQIIEGYVGSYESSYYAQNQDVEGYAKKLAKQLREHPLY